MGSPVEDGFEHVDLSDSIGKEVAKGPIDSAGLSETAGKQVTKGVGEGVALDDASAQNITKGVEENFDLVEVVNQFITKGIVEDTGLTDDADVADVAPVIGYSKPFTYDVGWRDVINIVNKTVDQRYKGNLETVWESDLAYTLKPSEVQVIQAVSTDDPFTDAQIPIAGARTDSSIVPENYDYILESGAVNITLSRTSGQSLNITLTNPSGVNSTFITGLRLIARPVQVYQSVKMENRDDDSVDVNGPKSMQEELPWANYNDTYAISEIVLNQRFKRLPVVHFEVNNRNAASLRQALEVKLSDRINVTNYNTATEHDFFIEQVEHRIGQAGKVHRTVIGCEQVPVQQENPFTFNTTGRGFNQGVFADRASGVDYIGNLFLLDQHTLGSTKVLGL